jgi:hypothetical protein
VAPRFIDVAQIDAGHYDVPCPEPSSPFLYLTGRFGFDDNGTVLLGRDLDSTCGCENECFSNGPFDHQALVGDTLEFRAFPPPLVSHLRLGRVTTDSALRVPLGAKVLPLAGVLLDDGGRATLSLPMPASDRVRFDGHRFVAQTTFSPTKPALIDDDGLWALRCSSFFSQMTRDNFFHGFASGSTPSCAEQLLPLTGVGVAAVGARGSPDEARFITYTLEDGRVVRSVGGAAPVVTGPVCRGPGGEVVVLADDGTHLYDPTSQVFTRVGEAHPNVGASGHATACAYDPLIDELVVVGGSAQTPAAVHAFDLTTGRYAEREPVAPFNGGGSLAFDEPTGQLLYMSAAPSAFGSFAAIQDLHAIHGAHEASAVRVELDLEGALEGAVTGVRCTLTGGAVHAWAPRAVGPPVRVAVGADGDIPVDALWQRAPQLTLFVESGTSTTTASGTCELTTVRP